MTPAVTDFQCAPTAQGVGGFRVSAIVNGRAVAGWVNTYMAQPTPNVAASLIAHAEAICSRA